MFYTFNNDFSARIDVSSCVKLLCNLRGCNYSDVSAFIKIGFHI